MAGATNKQRLQLQSPAFSEQSGIDLANKIDDLMALVNALKASNAALHAQLDTDGGVTETDYAASFDVALADVTLD